MKKFLFKIQLFFAAVITIDFCAGFAGDFMQSHAKGGITKRIDDLICRDTHDVIVLGSSRAHHHYDTPFLSDTIGCDVYNAGFDGNGIIFSYGLLSLISERYKPRLIVYDVTFWFDIYQNPEDNQNIRYIDYLKPYYRHKAIGEIIKDVSNEEWYKIHSSQIRYNSKWLTLLSNNIRDGKKEIKGYGPLLGEISANNRGRVDDFSVPLDCKKIKYIEKFIELCQNNDVPLFFVVSPRYGVDNSEILKPIKDICSRKGVEILDYRCDKKYLNCSFFKDPVHLNSDGTRLFSHEIAKIIDSKLK